jgi:glycosyltransferase involved in cell wall biosynthesis
MRALRILYVAYPLLPVSDTSAGGAEQMLGTLERQMHARGHATAVAACAGSRASGEVLVTGEITREADRFEQRAAEHNARAIQHVRRMGFPTPHRNQAQGWGNRGTRRGYDLVHDEGGSFWSCAGEIDVPVLATLHLPRSFYRQELFAWIPENVYFNCVSESQARSFGDLPRMMGVIENGIEVERFPVTAKKDNFLLWLGRICEEKGAHVAIEAARMAKLPLVIAGQVYPFSYHHAYFKREVRRWIDGCAVRFVERPDFAAKLDLLRRARALLVPALAEETSSLVALEAMACGTPVIGFRRGALPKIVAHGETGSIVESAEEMARAVGEIRVSAKACRERVERFYSSERMAEEYEGLYGRVIAIHEDRLLKAA